MKKNHFVITQNNGTHFSGECHPDMTVAQAVQEFLSLPLAEGRFHDGGMYNSDMIFEYNNDPSQNNGLDWEYSMSISYSGPTSTWQVSI